ncbi:MAG: PDGLE domain-containing protein [Methanobacteriaceae archaeon]|nr:PDGLE domain-containing protein [Methanobacteriaceae archaeon]
MNKKDKYLIAVALIICFAVACLSPFIASGNPDGLEKSAENVGVGDSNTFLQSPFPDYTFGPLGSLGEVSVLVLGIIITLALGYGIGEIVKRRN